MLHSKDRDYSILWRCWRCVNKTWCPFVEWHTATNEAQFKCEELCAEHIPKNKLHMHSKYTYFALYIYYCSIRTYLYMPTVSHTICTCSIWINYFNKATAGCSMQKTALGSVDWTTEHALMYTVMQLTSIYNVFSDRMELLDTVCVSNVCVYTGLV